MITTWILLVTMSSPYIYEQTLYNEKFATQEECLAKQKLVDDQMISKFPELEWSSECLSHQDPAPASNK